MLKNLKYISLSSFAVFFITFVVSENNFQNISKSVIFNKNVKCQPLIEKFEAFAINRKQSSEQLYEKYEQFTRAIAKVNCKAHYDRVLSFRYFVKQEQKWKILYNR